MKTTRNKSKKEKKVVTIQAPKLWSLKETSGQILLLYGITIAPSTIRNWCKTRHIGQQFGGKWFVDPEKLKQMLDSGKNDAKEKDTKRKK